MEDTNDSNEFDDALDDAIWQLSDEEGILELPDTVTTLATPHGSKVYVVGTAHFSKKSHEDVAKTIRVTQPDVVVLELCRSRLGILTFNEEQLLQESRNMTFSRARHILKQQGFLQGVLHLLLVRMSAHLTEQLGMAPGGEFRAAVNESKLVPRCRINLGDRPIEVTLRRAIAALTTWQKFRLAWHMLMASEPVTKEEVEKFKEKDILEELLAEMTEEFPELSRVFVTERDEYLANSLRTASEQPTAANPAAGEPDVIPSVVVGVVGIGHVPGIVHNWEKEINYAALMELPGGADTAGSSGRLFGSKTVKFSIRLALTAFCVWGCYRVAKLTPLRRLLPV